MDFIDYFERKHKQMRLLESDSEDYANLVSEIECFLKTDEAFEFFSDISINDEFCGYIYDANISDDDLRDRLSLDDESEITTAHKHEYILTITGNHSPEGGTYAIPIPASEGEVFAGFSVEYYQGGIVAKFHGFFNSRCHFVKELESNNLFEDVSCCFEERDVDFIISMYDRLSVKISI